MALLLTPTHFLTLCNYTNYWRCLTTARCLGKLSRLNCPTLGILWKTIATAFEVCWWSLSPAPSFTTSQLLRAAAGLSFVCLLAISLSLKQPWYLKPYKISLVWPPERLAHLDRTSRHLIRLLCFDTVGALGGGDVDRNDTCHLSPVNGNPWTHFRSSNFNRISQTDRRLWKNGA